MTMVLDDQPFQSGSDVPVPLTLGFKGAVIAIVDPAYKESIEKELTEKYLAEYPEYEDTFKVSWVKPDDGARFVED